MSSSANGKFIECVETMGVEGESTREVGDSFETEFFEDENGIKFDIWFETVNGERVKFGLALHGKPDKKEDQSAAMRKTLMTLKKAVAETLGTTVEDLSAARGASVKLKISRDEEETLVGDFSCDGRWFKARLHAAVAWSG